MERLLVLRLESMERHWKFDARQYARWRADMQGLVAPYAQDAAELALRRADWDLTRQGMSPDSTPAALRSRVDAVVARLQQAEQALSSPLAEQIGLGRRANLLAARIQAGQQAVDDAIAYTDRRLFRTDAPPLWRVKDASTLRQDVADSLPANRIEHRADHTAMNAVVGKVSDQCGPHVDAGLNALGCDLDELQAQGFVEDDFFFVDLAKTFDVLGFQNDGVR